MESKDHKWREAPVVGIDNFSKKSADESLDKKFNYGNLPSQELQKNNENFDLKRNLQEFPQKTITNELYDKKNNFGTHKYIENQDFNKIQKENIYENNVLKEIENMPYKLKSNVYNQDAEKEQGKVIIANVPNKRKTELKKKGEENENMTSH